MKTQYYALIPVGITTDPWFASLNGDYQRLYIHIRTECGMSGLFENDPESWNDILKPSIPFDEESAFNGNFIDIVYIGNGIGIVLDSFVKFNPFSFEQLEAELADYGIQYDEWVRWSHWKGGDIGDDSPDALTERDAYELETDTERDEEPNANLPFKKPDMPPVVASEPNAADSTPAPVEPQQNPVSDALTRFKKPTLEQVADYCAKRGNGIDAQSFVDYYESVGWKVGKKPMKDWQAAVRTWERNHAPTAKPSPMGKVADNTVSTKQWGF